MQKNLEINQQQRGSRRWREMMVWRIFDFLPFGKSYYFFLCRQIVESFSIEIVLLPPILVVAFIYVV